MSPTIDLVQPRRNRRTASIRALVQEHRLHPSDLVVPLFAIEGRGTTEPITSMPGIHRYTLDLLVQQATQLYQQGIPAVDLFAVVPDDRKDPMGSEATRAGNLLQEAVKAVKQACPELCVMVDVALDPFTDHGHDGVINERGDILNDASIERLIQMSLLLAEAGADIIAPSDMMDGRVRRIREALDQNAYGQVGILSYTSKYASAFYGPFREALHSSPKFGDKKTYQMNPANSREALLEASLDIQEGADMLLVKPALPYLDVLAKIKETSSLPVGAYHVSGEYAMVMAAAEKGWIDPQAVFYESLLGIKRAGADFILTYASPFVLPLIT